MIVGYGIDIMTTSRIRETIDRYGDRFLNKIYTGAELAACRRRGGSVEAFTAFWAAKEAAMKALGTGFRQGVKWKELEVCHEPTGKPYLRFSGTSGAIAARLRVNNIVLSMSHLDEIVVASVILEHNP